MEIWLDFFDLFLIVVSAWKYAIHPFFILSFMPRHAFEPVISPRLTAFLTWCGEQSAYAGLLPARNPAKTKKAREALGKAGTKSDVLQREQLAAWFAAVQQIQNPVIAACLQIMLLTGARPGEVLAQIQDHKPSATAEKPYKVRPLEQLRVHHEKIEAWILEQAGIAFDANTAPGALRVVVT